MSDRKFEVIVNKKQDRSSKGKPTMLRYPPIEGVKALALMREMKKREYIAVAETSANGITEQLSLAEMETIFDASKIPVNNFDGIVMSYGVVTEISEELYYYSLKVLPPIYGEKCFAMGEVYKHTSENEEVYYCFAKVGARYFCTLATLTDANAIFVQMHKREMFNSASEIKTAPLFW